MPLSAMGCPAAIPSTASFPRDGGGRVGGCRSGGSEGKDSEGALPFAEDEAAREASCDVLPFCACLREPVRGCWAR